MTHLVQSAVCGQVMRRFEVGGQATNLNFTDYDAAGPGQQPGFGVGVALNLQLSLAVESKLNLTLGTKCPYSPVCGGRAIEFLLGARTEARERRWGLFAEVEPGFVSWSALQLPSSSQVPAMKRRARPLFGSAVLFYDGNWWGVEYAPAVRLHCRVNLGDLLMRHDGSQLIGFNGPASLYCFDCKRWLNNLDLTGGAYWSLGKPMEWVPPDMHAKPQVLGQDKSRSAYGEPPRPGVG